MVPFFAVSGEMTASRGTQSLLHLSVESKIRKCEFEMKKDAERKRTSYEVSALSPQGNQCGEKAIRNKRGRKNTTHLRGWCEICLCLIS